MNVKRKLLATLLASALIGVGTHTAGAVDYTWHLEKGFFGGVVQSKPDMTIKIDSTTKYLQRSFCDGQVRERQRPELRLAVRLGDGTSYFPQDDRTQRIDAGNAMVRVMHPSEHYDGG